MSTAARLGHRRWPRWVAALGWSALGLLGAGFGVYSLTVTLGAVHGIELCPQTFERRSYRFYELPAVGLQVTPVRHQAIGSPAETFLTAQKYIALPPTGAKRDWHVVVSSRGLRPGRRGDAAILVQYLDALDSEENHRWIKWSERHPELAKVLWPAVQRLATRQLYVFIPDVFELTKSSDDPAALKQAIDREVARRLLTLARRLAERGDRAAAAAALDEAALLDPANQEIQQAQRILQNGSADIYLKADVAGVAQLVEH